jgi:ADP-ribosylglycohydrolase
MQMDDWERFIKTFQKGSREDRIIGMIYGHAIGDAVGLTTEFKFQRDKPKVEFPYSTNIRNFPICDWTEDTDHMIIVM